ncbi:MAG: DUF362 domain-containing protein, partial [Acidimicrobiia bacterium]|nr:DUF362 domain-containing protein [Acidimicrobiia bacterium]
MNEEMLPGLAGLTPPPLYRVRQTFPRPALADAAAVVTAEVNRPEVLATLEGKASVAVAVGSRGIAGIDRIVAALVTALREAGVDPFVVPSMGSHGGATAEGQESVLAHLGITEASVGAPVRSSMATTAIGTVTSPH